MRWAWLVLVALAAAPAAAGRADWVGSTACAACHPRQAAAWQTTAHARTGARLPARASTRCLTCHATGDAPTGASAELGVGCEACHGSGAHYAPADVMANRELARALGLVALDTPEARAVVCQRCHVPGLALDAAALEAAAPNVHPIGAP